MDTDDDKDLKPPLNNVTSVTVNTTTPSINGPTNNSNSTPIKVQEEIKQELMDIENTKASQEKKNSSDKDKRTTSGPTDDTEIPLVNGTLSDSDKEHDTNVSANTNVSSHIMGEC